MNLGQMRDRLYRMIGEKPDAPVYVSATLANEIINDAYLETAILSGVLEIRHGIHSVASTAEYSLPNNVSRPFRVAYDSYALVPTSQRELDEQDPYHRTRTGQPEAFSVDRLNERTIRLYPIPSATGASSVFSAEYGDIVRITGDDTWTFSDEFGTEIRMTSTADTYVFSGEFGVVTDIGVSDIDVWAKKVPDRMLTDVDEPETPTYSHLGIVYSAAARALQARTEIKNLELAAIYETYAQDYLRQMIRLANNRQPERVQRMATADRVRTFRLARDTEIPEP